MPSKLSKVVFPETSFIFLDVAGRFAFVGLLFIAVFSANAWSEEVQPDVEFAPEQDKLQWTPAEQYNAVNGTMNYRQTDLYLPGNGKLPITVTRTFNQGPIQTSGDELKPTGNFGRSTMDMPLLSISTLSSRDEDIYCMRDGGFNSRVSLTRPVAFRVDGTSRTFRREGNILITKDGWKAECVANRGTLGPFWDFTGTMIVTRPDGVEYEMRLSLFNPGVNGPTSSFYSIHKITDAYENTLTYQYDVYSYQNSFTAFKRISSITANDGRTVTFSYRSNNAEAHYGALAGYSDDYSFVHIAKIVSNSSKNPISLEYTYLDNYNTLEVTENSIEKTRIETSETAINKIVYPAGGTVSYAYGEVRTTAGTAYRTLQTRTTSSGAVYNFDYTDLGSTFIRHVNTPSARLQYTYGDPVKPDSAGKIVDHDINSGRLISYSRSEPTGKTLFSVDYEYVNLDEWTPDQLQQVVRPKKTTTRMNFDGSGNARSVFTTENLSFDEWGFPYEVVESSPVGDKISSTYTYASDAYGYVDAYSRVVIGNVKTINRPGDIQVFNYNSQGDIISHNDNGVSTGYGWHYSGDSRGEMKTRTSALGRTTSFENYKRGQAQYITNPHDFSQKRVINDNGTLASETRFTKYLSASTSEIGTRYGYDSLRRLSLVDPERRLSEGTITRWINNVSRTTQNERYDRFAIYELFDGFGRTRVKTHSDSDQSRRSTVVYEYDSEGRLRFTSYPVEQLYTNESDIPSSLRGTHYEYDALNRITRVIQNEEAGNDTVINYTYETENTPFLNIKETDGRGSVKTTLYKAFGAPHYQWPVKIVEADNVTTYITRSGSTGRVDSTIQGNRNTRYDYNSNNQLESITQHENGVTSMTYYADGRLRTRTNNGRGVEYSYYPDGLISRERFTDADKEDVTREYFYDDYGNVETAVTTSPSGSQDNTLSYAYDEDNNVTRIGLVIDARSDQIVFEYDELSNLEQITYPNGRAYSLNPNSLGSPTSIRQIGGSGKILYDQIQYNANHSMKLMQRAGHAITNELNLGLRPGKFRVKENGDSNAALGERTYLYDRAANVFQINDTVADRYMVLDYDGRNRLISENISNADNWSYGYTANNDIDWIQHGSVRSDFKYDPGSRRLHSVETGDVGRVYDYDQQGNMTAHERLQGDSKVTRLLTRNAANQLVALSDGTNYSYDARGLRVKQDRDGAIYTLYGPGERLMFRFDEKTKVTSEYFYVDGKLVARRDTDLDSTPVEPPDDVTEPEPPSDDDLWPEPPSDDDLWPEPPNDELPGVTVDGLTISWPDDGWYQVQSEDGSTNICGGGRSCTVPSSGIYQVINHSTGGKKLVPVK